MKYTLLMLGTVLLVGLSLAGCSKNGGGEAASAKNLKTYVDPSTFGFSVRYPDGWLAATEPGRERSRAIFYSSQEIVDGFSQLQPKGNTGAKIEVIAQPGDQSGIETNLKDLKDALADDPNAVKPMVQTTVNGMPASMVRYSFVLEDENFTAERYFVVADSVLTTLEVAVIGKFEDYKNVFDSVRATFQPGRKKAPATAADTAAVRDSIVVDPPAAEMKSYSGAFTMSYPANFSPNSLSNGVVFSGTRVDSKVQVNIYPTKDVTLDKIVESSKASYKGATPSKTTVGGQPAYVFSYSSGSTSARAYYVVVGKNLFVITTIWFSAQRDLYAPAFEKMVASFRAR